MEGFSSDGDPRLLSSMLYYTKQNLLKDQNGDIPDFVRHISLLCLQDIIHLLTKLRNRLLLASIHLPLGNKLISLSHLKLLINNVSKSTHGLVMKDICPDDRQNFNSLERMMTQRVYDALSENIVGSEGTVMYLKLCEVIASSLIDETLKPEERIFKLTYAAFFFRIWRKWLQKSNLSVEENFISRNAYTCIELNAANIVLLTKRFRDQNIEELFMPTLFNSQPNEEIFRQFRSMGTINFTKINFTLLELFHLVGRVELQNDIVYFKLAEKDIQFPRNKLNQAKLNQHKLPSDTQISETINKAKDALNFGMKMEMNEVASCELFNLDNIQRRGHITSDESENIIVSDEENTESRDKEVRSSTIEITLGNGTKKNVRKSTYLWTLTDSATHLSSDRLKRVQGVKIEERLAKSTKLAPHRLVFRKETNCSEPILTLSICESLQIGDWCFFQIEKDLEPVFLLGNILSFRYIEGRTRKAKQYSWEFAPITVAKNVKPRGIEVLASWFKVGQSTNLFPIAEVNSYYINIKNYVINLNCTHMNLYGSSGCLTFTNDIEVLKKIHGQLSRFANKIKT